MVLALRPFIERLFGVVTAWPTVTRAHSLRQNFCLAMEIVVCKSRRSWVLQARSGFSPSWMAGPRKPSADVAEHLGQGESPRRVWKRLRSPFAFWLILFFFFLWPWLKKNPARLKVDFFASRCQHRRLVCRAVLKIAFPLPSPPWKKKMAHSLVFQSTMAKKTNYSTPSSQLRPGKMRWHRWAVLAQPKRLT